VQESKWWRWICLGSDPAVLPLLLYSWIAAHQATVVFVRFLLQLIPEKAPDQVDKLSLMNWVVHLTTMALGVDVASSLRRSDGCARTQAIAAIFLIATVSGWILLLSHTLVDVDVSLERQLYNVGRYLTRLHVFMMGIINIFPQRGWYAAVPIFYLIMKHVLDFGSIYGIALSSTAVMGVLTAPPRNFQPLFKIGYILMAFVPAIIPRPSTDWGHMIGDLCVSIPLVLLSYGLRAQSIVSTKSS